MSNHPHLAPWAKALEELCLTMLKKMGGRGTVRAVSDATGKGMELLGPRFTALCKAGKIQDTGKRISAGRGRPQVVWKVTEEPVNTSNYDIGTAGDVPEWFRRFGN